jgi:hypothetical protein
MAKQNVKQNAEMAGEKPTGASACSACFDRPQECRLTPRQPCRRSHGRSDTSFAKSEISGNDYASDELPEPPPSRLSSETARDISPKQAAVAISDDQNATHSRAGMTFPSSAGWVT